MNTQTCLDLAESILAGKAPDQDQYMALANAKEDQVFSLLGGADLIRDHYFGRKVHLCTICNGKSGKCSEDCSFCSQSAFASSDIEEYPLMGGKELQAGADYALEKGIHRYSIVTSGRRLPRHEVEKVAEAYAGMTQDGAAYCASLGILEAEDFRILKQAGVSRYHHNLEAAPSLFPDVCSTHLLEERIQCIRAAKEAGLSVCAGGIFGIGESDEQALEMALTLKELDVDAVPLNFLIAIPGTRMEKAPSLNPLRCIKIIALFRYVLPDKEILICGGREANLANLHSWIFHAGASGIMTGNYLTAKGRTPEDDFRLLEELGFATR